MTAKARILQRSFPLRVVCTALVVLAGTFLALAWAGYPGFLGATRDGTAIAVVFAGSLIGRCVLQLRRHDC